MAHDKSWLPSPPANPASPSPFRFEGAGDIFLSGGEMQNAVEGFSPVSFGLETEPAQDWQTPGTSDADLFGLPPNGPSTASGMTTTPLDETTTMDCTPHPAVQPPVHVAQMPAPFRQLINPALLATGPAVETAPPAMPAAIRQSTGPTTPAALSGDNKTTPPRRKRAYRKLGGYPPEEARAHRLRQKNESQQRRRAAMKAEREARAGEMVVAGPVRGKARARQVPAPEQSEEESTDDGCGGELEAALQAAAREMAAQEAVEGGQMEVLEEGQVEDQMEGLMEMDGSEEVQQAPVEEGVQQAQERSAVPMLIGDYGQQAQTGEGRTAVYLDCSGMPVANFLALQAYV